MNISSKTLIPIIALAGVAVFFSCITSIWGMFAPVFRLSEDQVFYLFSTSAQVLAGVYGLTLTGFIFFRNELSREQFEDETLVEAVESLKLHYFVLLVFITAIVLITFALSNVAISDSSGGKSPFSFCIQNIAQSLFATSLIAIAYFIFDVTLPRKIARASVALKNQVDPVSRGEIKGSLEDFIRNYNKIESILNDIDYKYGSANVPHGGKSGRTLSNARFAEVLFRNEKISEKLYGSLKRLITLRNSIIHGADPVVSQKMVLESASVLDQLQLVLGVVER